MPVYLFKNSVCVNAKLDKQQGIQWSGIIFLKDAFIRFINATKSNSSIFC